MKSCSAGVQSDTRPKKGFPKNDGTSTILTDSLDLKPVCIKNYSRREGQKDVAGRLCPEAQAAQRRSAIFFCHGVRNDECGAHII
jgi:hypothetical protein